ncbi:MAG: carbon-nitrogen hydrolase family protein [bacterium]|nr:carbon-nitrogen hydrolase family protein [bacterium]
MPRSFKRSGALEVRCKAVPSGAVPHQRSVRLRIALAQTQPGPDRARNLEHVVHLLEQAAADGAGIIAFPELALSRFFPQHPENAEATALAEPIPGPTTDVLSKRARALSLVVVFNLYESDGSGCCFDSSPVIDADGQLLGVTRMVHITDYPGFHERAYYHPGDRGAPVYATRAGRVGVAICYDRHYPEYMRSLGAGGAEIVVIPQAGVVGEWPEGLYEAEVRTAAFQNGYYAALCNRTGREEGLEFAGESFVVDPQGVVLNRAARSQEDLLLVDCDLEACARSTARRLFWRDRRPELYADWLR